MTIGLFCFHLIAVAVNNVTTLDSMRGVSFCNFGYEDYQTLVPNIYNKGIISNLFSFFDSYFFWWP